MLINLSSLHLSSEFQVENQLQKADQVNEKFPEIIHAGDLLVHMNAAPSSNTET